MRTDELDFDLPDELIATTAAEPRDAARLMVCRRDRPIGADIEHVHVRDLPTVGVVRAGDLMLVNRTRVLPAYFEGVRVGTGGRVRGLYLEAADGGRSLVMLEVKGTLRAGERVRLQAALSRATNTPQAREASPAGVGDVELVLVESRGRGAWVVELAGDASMASVLERVGATPLPPYIRKMRRRLGLAEVGEADATRYNTVYAATGDRIGSVAAPTAGLHFTPELLAELETLGVRRAAVTLGVGLGTFEPVRVEALDQHRMHHERVHVPAETVRAIRETRLRGGRVLVVGTTTVRAVESLPDPGGPADLAPGLDGAGWSGETNLFIYPRSGFAWRFTDSLMTNFHLPRSTLLAMVAALPGVGVDRLRGWYREAVDRGYRFYSYGDAMLVV